MTFEFKHPTYAELDAIERRAAQLRAEVLHRGLRRIAAFLFKTPQALLSALRQGARA